MKYQVFDNNKPAQYPHCNVHPTWDNSVFDSLGEAQNYVKKWLGQYCAPNPLKINEKYEYSSYGDYVEIRAVE